MSEPTKRIEKIIGMPGYFVIMDGTEFHADFKVYEVTGYTMEDKPLFGDDFAEDIATVDVYLHGVIKWDGCGHLHFDEQERVMLHVCTKRDAVTLAALIVGLWDMAAEAMNRDIEDME